MRSGPTAHYACRTLILHPTDETSNSGSARCRENSRGSGRAPSSPSELLWQDVRFVRRRSFSIGANQVTEVQYLRTSLLAFTDAAGLSACSYSDPVLIC